MLMVIVKMAGFLRTSAYFTHVNMMRAIIHGNLRSLNPADGQAQSSQHGPLGTPPQMQLLPMLSFGSL
jgi:hypothetical protein